MNEMKLTYSKGLKFALILLTVLALITACQVHASLSPEETALIIMREDSGLLNLRRASGSILTNGEKVWRYQGNYLKEVAWSDYKNALDSNDRSSWPPYTVTFSMYPLSDDNAIQVEVEILYDMGLSESSRGGNSSVWKLKNEDGQWKVIDIEETGFWD